MPPKYTQNDILIRPYTAEDYNDHFSVLMESEILKKYEQDLKKDLDDGELPYGSNIENYSVLLKSVMVYCGYVELQNIPMNIRLV